MTDDDLIRDAVHELVAASPPAKPLAGHRAPSPRSYRWLAVAAAAILIVGGIVAIAWTRGNDDEQPAATTPTEPTPTSIPVVVPPRSSSPEVSAPPPTTSPATSPSVAPTSAVPTTTLAPTTTSIAPTTTLAPATPEEANLLAYLTALAEGRYDDAAVFLREGGLEHERRADLRPLFDEYGDVDDLAGRLEQWCTNEAMCTTPDTPPADNGSGYWVATWNTAGGPLTGFFRSSSFEGAAMVGGLPPRRFDGSVVACPTDGAEWAREGELDGDGVPETIVLRLVADRAALLVDVCNTSLTVPTTELPRTYRAAAGVLQPASATDATLLLGESGETGVCMATYRLAASAGALVAVGWDGCWGMTGESVGCREVAGESQIVGYQYTFVGGSGLNDSTAMHVDVIGFDGTPLESFTLTLPDQIDEALQVVEPYCNGLPAVTEG